MSNFEEVPDRDAKKLIIAYMRGWYAGAGRRSLDPAAERSWHKPEGEEYLRGYTAGQKAAKVVHAEQEKFWGVEMAEIKAM